MVRNTAARRMLPVVMGLIALLLPSSLAAAERSPRPTGTGTHCVVNLQPVEAGQAESRVASELCFSTFADAISHATNGYTKLRSSDGPENLSDAMLPQAMAAEYVLGIDYDAWHYIETQGSKIWTASTGCDFANWYTVSSLGNWNDRISSAKGYSGCVNFRHFEHNDFQGAVRTCTCYYIGDAMNDRTSSLHFDD